MAKRWYIVHAYSNFENKVADSIREQAKQRQNNQDRHQNPEQLHTVYSSTRINLRRQCGCFPENAFRPKAAR